MVRKCDVVLHIWGLARMGRPVSNVLDLGSSADRWLRLSLGVVLEQADGSSNQEQYKADDHEGDYDREQDQHGRHYGDQFESSEMLGYEPVSSKLGR
jgi:hypothetical protein